MTKLPVGDLVLDFALYPRADVDRQHCSYMAEAIRAGATLPPVIIDKKSKRVTDGFHRVRTYLRVYDPNHKIEVIEKSYRTDAAMFLDAMRYNASHGRMLSTFDRAHCILLGEQFGIEPDQIAGALQITMDAVGKLKADRVGTLRTRTVTSSGQRKGQRIPLKRTIRHMSGTTLTKAQYEANDKLSGMEQLFYVNQLVTLIENDLLDKENEKLFDGLRKLHELLESVLVAA